MIARRFLLPTAAAGATAAALLLGVTAAGAAVPDRSTFGPDPYGNSFSCPGFDAVYSGQDHGTVTTFFDSNGTPTSQLIVGHAIETDINLSTGKSVVFRANSTLHAVLDANGNQVSWALSGDLQVGTSPGQGIVLHDSGRVTQVLSPDGSVLTTALKGVHDSFINPNAFCDALN